MKLVLLAVACCVVLSEQVSARTGTRTRSRPGKCRYDEVYQECGCEKNCCNRGNPTACSKECLSGCFCRDGLFRDNQGKCIKLEDCPVNDNPNPPIKCGRDEQYYDNKPECKNTCENYDNPGVLCAIGEPGCFCKDGLVKRRDGKCVLPKDCNNGTCGPNEQYSDCVNPCNDCASIGVTCNFLVCNKGCDCRFGFRRDSQGICIPESECPTDNGFCGPNSTPSTCASQCPPTCSNPSPICDQVCVDGCVCDPGYVMDDNGNCIPKDQCPSSVICGPNSTPSDCASLCPPTCGNRSQFCATVCVKGCVCDYGYVLDDNGICIPENLCPQTISCGLNEVYNECGGCQATCSDRNPICTRQCRRGCFCDKGFIRKEKNGTCVPIDECPPEIQCSPPKCGPGCRINFKTKPCPSCLCDQNPGYCGLNEVYKECGSCQATCSNRNPICTQQCREGCYCKKGFIREKTNGHCIPDNQCPPEIQCSPPKCGPGCRINYKTKPCPSCLCDQNPGSCGLNEVYKECGSCQATCSNRNPICTQQCREGCYCKKGFIREKTNGHCIPDNQCPPEIQCSPPKCGPGCRINYKTKPCPSCLCDQNPGSCGLNEVYKECGRCDATCSNRNPICTLQCVEGCYCKEGFIREKTNGHCIRANQCPPDSCGLNEVYKECGSCDATCSNRNPICTLQCREGCYCKEGFIREKTNGHCIRANQCPPAIQCSPPKCGPGCQINYETKPCPSCRCGQNTTNPCDENEVYNFCGTACQRTCAKKNPACTKQCAEGCFCRNGFIREKEGGKCIPENRCPTEIQCSPPKCRPGCRINYQTKPCPSCECGPSYPLCPRIVCPAPCHFEYGGRRCPECVCNHNPTNPGGIQCDIPKCEKGCQLNYETKPCPSCDCKKNNTDTRDYICKREGEIFKNCGSPCQATCANRRFHILIKCPQKCRPGCFCIDGLLRDSNNKCVKPSQCDNEVQCSPPKCRPGCRINYQTKPCPSCECGPSFPICPRIVCPAPCHFEYGGRRCPECVCNRNSTNPGGIQCDIPKCGKGCQINYDTKPCPSCDCKKNNTGVICHLPKCGVGCRIVNTGKPCPSCVCDGNDNNPKNPICKPDEQYYDCVPSCRGTCEQPNKDQYCKMACVPGCYCKEGLVKREKDGRCVKPEDCESGTNPEKPTCKPDEQYYDCIPYCRGTCETYNKPILCNMECISGCYCKEGLVKRKDGRCVKPKDCETGTKCGRNEKFSTCVNPCNDCQTKGKCNFLVCNKGCDCIKGFYRDDKGRCIPEKKCPVKSCGKNEIIVDCAKPKWCNTCEIRGNCKLASCTRGCDCKDGYYRNDNGVCIPKSQCPNVCPPNEVYFSCGSACPPTCDNKKPGVCTLQCVEGCFCKKGFIREKKDGFCIPENQCPPDRICPLINCIRGCYLDNTAKPCPRCVCDNTNNGTDICLGRGEVFKSCGSPCQATCANRKFRIGIKCPKKCEPGCFCRDGLVRDSDDNCVEPSQCGNDDICPLIRCAPGCRTGYGDNGCPKCVCDQNGCGKNEIIVDCAKPKWCNTCEIRGNCKLASCTRGCDCKDGYYRNDNGVCIPKSQCPNVCPPNEAYVSCGSACPPTCDDKKPGFCTLQCVEGCFCKKGFIREKIGGICIRENQCPAENTCKPDEEMYDCTPFCSNRCNPLRICPRICKKGCFCRRGLVMNDEGKCVRKDQCQNCREDQQFYTCKPSCKNTCENYNKKDLICPAICEIGCFCKDGYVLRNDGTCVRPEECIKIPVCPRIACGANCHFENRGPCPVCVCSQNSTNSAVPVCPRIACGANCHFENRDPCPVCVCPQNSTNSGDTSRSSESSQTSYANSKASNVYSSSDESEVYDYQSSGQEKTDVGFDGYGQTNNFSNNREYRSYTSDDYENDLQLLFDEAVEDYFSRDNDNEKYSKREITPNYGEDGTETDSSFEQELEDEFSDYYSTNVQESQQSSQSHTNVSEYEYDDFEFDSENDEFENPNKRSVTTKSGTCKEDEQYYDCIPSCKNNCENYNKDYIRCGCNGSGCFCKEGLVMNKNKKCVKPEDCN